MPRGLTFLSALFLTHLVFPPPSSAELKTIIVTGEQESQAWPILEGIKVPQGRKIHSDMERGFICAGVYDNA